MTRRFGLPKSQRLTKPAEFSATIKHGARSRDRYFTVYARHAAHAARLGVAVSRRTAPTAVTRNRLKRHVREAFRCHKSELVGLELVVVAEPASASADTATLRTSLRQHWERIVERCSQS